MIYGFLAVYWRELLILRRRLKKQLAGAAVAPFLYLVTFGYALGGRLDMDGHGYLEFLLPGLAAMSSMTQAFGIAAEINVARFYSGVFEEIQASPTSRFAYVLGEACAGLTRALLGCCVILALGMAFGVPGRHGIFFWLPLAMNGFAFACLGTALAMLVKSHADQALLNNFVITPMAFLGGTFFPVDRLPEWAQAALSWLPLTHATRLARAASLGSEAPGMGPWAALAVSGAAFFCLAAYAVGKARD